MTVTLDRDVVVLGAGIAGLLLASELCGRFSVSVLEKEADLPNRKYWVTSAGSVGRNPELLPFLDSQLEYMDITAYDLTSCRVRGPFPMWDSDRLLGHLVKSIKRSGGEVCTGTRFYSYYREQGRMVLLAGTRRYRALLVIDCMGFSSPIVSAKNLNRIAGYYFLTGARVPLREPLDPIAFYNLCLAGRPRYIEVFPTKSGDAHAVIITPASSLQPDRGLREELTFALHQSHLQRHFDPIAKSHGVYGGIVPVGFLRRRSMDNFFVFGEAGQVNPAATGTGLTRMLYVYKDTVGALATCLETRRLTAGDLEHAVPQTLTTFNRRIQMSVFRAMQRWTSDDFRELVRELATLPQEMVCEILFGELEPSRFLSLRNLLGAVKARNHFLLRHAARAILPIS